MPGLLRDSVAASPCVSCRHVFCLRSARAPRLTTRPSLVPHPPPWWRRYVIPTSVVRHFLTDFMRHGKYNGFPSLVRKGGGVGGQYGVGRGPAGGGRQ